MNWQTIAVHRDFLKDTLRQTINFKFTDKQQGTSAPPIQKQTRENQKLINLPGMGAWDSYRGTDLLDAIFRRQSHRKFKSEHLTLAELAFLLWSTQGIKNKSRSGSTTRMVPSAGCRHPFETYLMVNCVEGLESGVYRYLPKEHALVLECLDKDLVDNLTLAAMGRVFIGSAPVTFVWTSIPYRSEWSYTTAAHRVILMDAGHICQNLYLAAEAIGCGTCAIASFKQELMDKLVKVDGVDEFTVYMAPVGNDIDLP